MLKIKISSLKPGVKLGKDIYSYDGKLLLPRGSIIGQEELNQFSRRNIEEVFVAETNSNLKSQKDFQDVYCNSLDITKFFMMEARLGRKLNQREITETIDLLVMQVFDQNDLFGHMRMMKDKDDYLFTHSVNVSLLCILMGRWLKCDEKIIRELGLAGLLHDIGKVFIPNKILNKADKLTEEEFAEIKKHPMAGYNYLLECEWVNEDVSNAVLMHHERRDGTGYPLGLKDDDIGFFASVVSVADVYDALTSQRIYSPKVSPYSAADVLWEESFGKLDPRISKVFYDKITAFYVGNEVLLSNDEKGVVVFIDPGQPTRPLVMVGDSFCNLAKDRSLSIVKILD